MELQGILPGQSGAATAGNRNVTSALGAGDFLNLLVAQLMNQDPLEPTSNQDLLNQISSIREIELTTNLSDSLRSLTEQERFTSAASLIGKYATLDNGSVGGVIVAVHFDEAGGVMVELEDGRVASLDGISSIMSGQRAAEALLGRMVTGIIRTDSAAPRQVEGIVTGTAVDPSGAQLVELDTGESLLITDVLDVGAQATPQTDAKQEGLAWA